MSQKHSLLLEFGVEELPAQSLVEMADTFARNLKLSLHDAHLNYADFTLFATPRRLGVLVSDLDGQQKDETVQMRGPSLKAAFDDGGQPKGPAKGFAASCGVSIEQLDRIVTPKGEYLAFNKFQKGQALSELVPGFVESLVKALSSSKTMRWGAGLDRFLRPLRWLTALIDTDVVPCAVYGLQADRVTYGHRIHHPGAISLTHAAEYEPRLQSRGYVIPQFHVRRQTIEDQINSIAVSQQLCVSPSKTLLEEITGLVEWPVTLLGSFDEAFLEVPNECLISTMEQNQKYIALYNPDGRLSNGFLFVANLESEAPEQVIQGNERVIRPRFADAKFFYDTDKRKPLQDLREGLKRVIYQKELGSVFDKTERMAAFAIALASKCKVDRSKASLAAQLSKVDLLTAMVGEFPELQGVMGRYYASAQDLDTELAQALEEQYLPKGHGDALPNTALGIVLSLTDKFDSLVGMFAIGKEPTADKDPFALRRMALGVVRMCIELELDLDAYELAEQSAQIYGTSIATAQISEQVAQFIMQRLPTLYKDSGIDMRLVRAVEVLGIYHPSDFNKRLVVLQDFYSGQDAGALAEVHKRVNNILKKNPFSGERQFKTHALVEEAEISLHQALEGIQPELQQARELQDYETILQLGASLRADVDVFFVHVKVMSDDAAQRHNRLLLLVKLRELLAEVGDLSFLA